MLRAFTRRPFAGSLGTPTPDVFRTPTAFPPTRHFHSAFTEPSESLIREPGNQSMKRKDKEEIMRPVKDAIAEYEKGCKRLNRCLDFCIALVGIGWVLQMYLVYDSWPKSSPSCTVE